jgi:hypothetical protein
VWIPSLEVTHLASKGEAVGVRVEHRSLAFPAPKHSSLVTQRDHRVDFHRPPRGDVAGEQRDSRHRN